MSQKGFTVEAVARLARLGPYPQESLQKLQKEMEKILDLFQALEKLPAGVQDRNFKERAAPFRQDEAKETAAREKILANFPEREGPLLKVPKVIE